MQLDLNSQFKKVEKRYENDDYPIIMSSVISKTGREQTLFRFRYEVSMSIKLQRLKTVLTSPKYKLMESLFKVERTLIGKFVCSLYNLNRTNSIGRI